MEDVNAYASMRSGHVTGGAPELGPVPRYMYSEYSLRL